MTEKKVLEIGLGEGADAERLIREGAHWSGVDLTAESIARVRTRLTLRELPYDELRQGSVLDLPFADGSFDMVFSHGVLHHVPEITKAQSEIHRVLRPGGELVIMMYARWSLNYLVSIALLRRAVLLAAFPLSRAGILNSDPAQGILATHLGNAKRMGLLRYLRLEEFVHHNTDGPAQPRTPWYTIVGGSRTGLPLPSGLREPTSASCMLRPSRFTGYPGKPLWAGICGCT